MRYGYSFALLLTAVFALTMSGAALAYVGPGAGLSLLGALWGLILAIGAALGFVIFWPIRQWRKRARAKRAAATTTVEPEAEVRSAERDTEDLRRRAP